MQSVIRDGDGVLRAAAAVDGAVHALLAHVRARGVDWVPEPLGRPRRRARRSTWIAATCPLTRCPAGSGRRRCSRARRGLRRLHDATTASRAPAVPGAARARAGRGDLPQRLRALQPRLPRRPAGRRDRLRGRLPRPARLGPRVPRLPARPARRPRNPDLPPQPDPAARASPRCAPPTAASTPPTSSPSSRRASGARRRPPRRPTRRCTAPTRRGVTWPRLPLERQSARLSGFSSRSRMRPRNSAASAP